MAITATAVGTAPPAAVRHRDYVVVSLGGLTLAMRHDEAADLAAALQGAIGSAAAAATPETNTSEAHAHGEGGCNASDSEG